MTKLEGKVVVMTGASSGIGRAAAIEFAKRGCHLFLAARREKDLEDTARMCRAAGSASATVVVTDVSHEEEVRRLADKVMKEAGRIDVWVNNAGVTLFALLEDGPFEEHRKVIETNLYGPMYAARAVIPLFKDQKHGIMINVGSVLSKVGQPFVPSYAISKFALRGLTEVLRTEVAEHRDIHICSLLPYATDTPHFEDGANERGVRPRPMPPTQTPEKIGRAIVKLAARPRREVIIPRAASLYVALHWMFPRTVERLLLRALRRWHFDRHPEAPTDGNLRTPKKKGSTRGNHGPQLSTPTFVLWSAAELVKIAVSQERP